MILCLGVSGSGKSMLLHCLKEKSLQLANGLNVAEAVAVVDLDDLDESSIPAPLLASVATVGTDFVRLSKPGVKRNSPAQGSLSSLRENRYFSGNLSRKIRLFSLIFCADLLDF
jgi:hypothetical protein